MMAMWLTRSGCATAAACLLFASPLCAEQPAPASHPFGPNRGPDDTVSICGLDLTYPGPIYTTTRGTGDQEEKLAASHAGDFTIYISCWPRRQAPAEMGLWTRACAESPVEPQGRVLEAGCVQDGSVVLRWMNTILLREHFPSGPDVTFRSDLFTRINQHIWGVAWLPDGRELTFSVNATGTTEHDPDEPALDFARLLVAQINEEIAGLPRQ